MELETFPFLCQNAHFNIIVWQCAPQPLRVGYYMDPHLNINLQPPSNIKTTTYKVTEITSEETFSKYLFVRYYGVLWKFEQSWSSKSISDRLWLMQR